MRTIFIFLLFLSGITGSKAQTFSINSLIGTKWAQIKDYEANSKTTIEFNDTYMVRKIHIALLDLTIFQKKFRHRSIKVWLVRQKRGYIWSYYTNLVKWII